MSRKIYLEDLPLNKNGTICWKNSVGCTVRFEYDDIKGTFNILDYDNTKYHVIVQYKDRIRSIFVGSLKECMISELIGLRHAEYKYNVDDIIYNSFKVLKQTKILHAKTRSHNAQSRSGKNKAYVLQCLKCNHIFTIGEDVFDDKTYKENCPACGKMVSKIVVGINDMWTTNPELACMLMNPEDGYRYMAGSNKKLNWICPNCGTIINNKSPAYIQTYGISCKNCRDTISYPERIMRGVLKFMEIDFDMHKTFQWSDNKEYDFVIRNKSMIIETHGIQHYEESRFTKRTLSEEQKNDRYKKQLALENGMNIYIEIDCRKNDFNYIYNNIKVALSDYFDFSNINENELNVYSVHNKFYDICMLWEKGEHDINKISKQFNLSAYTVRDYLKKVQI